MEPSAPTPEVLIVGGGVAGLSAAAALTERGVSVLLVEEAGVLGGKIQASPDRLGHVIEHGIHGWWDEYVNFKGLLEQAGIQGIFTKPLKAFNVCYPDRNWEELRPAPLAAPFGYYAMIRRLNIGFFAKFLAASAGMAIASFSSRRDYDRLLGIDLAAWIRRHFLPTRLDELVFEPTIRSNLFLPNALTSCADGLNALVRGTRRRDSWKVAWLTKNTHDAIVKPLRDYILARHGEIWEGCAVERLVHRDGAIVEAGIRRDRALVHFPVRWIILATDVVGTKKLLAPLCSVCPDLMPIQNLSGTDVITSRIWYAGERQLKYPDGVLLGSEIVDAFIAISDFQPEFRAEGVTVIETQTYRARSWMRAPETLIAERIRADLHQYLPSLEPTAVTHQVIARHQGVFTAFRAGQEVFRPNVTSPLSNLLFAGDWVRIPEPVMFMERAVTSGRRAANEILIQLKKEPWPIKSLPPADAPVRAIRLVARVYRALSTFLAACFRYQSIGGYRGA